MNIKTICVYGDSLVYGMGDNEKEGGWVTRLQEKTKDKFFFCNFGIPGDTSADLASRINEELKEKIPDIAIFLIGTNDSQYKGDDKENTLIDVENFKNNLKILTNKAKESTPNLIFIGLPKMDDLITTNWDYIYYFCNKNLQKYDSVIKIFCKENDFEYIPIFDILNETDLSDGAHPNSEGYEKIAKKVYNSIYNLQKRDKLIKT